MSHTYSKDLFSGKVFLLYTFIFRQLNSPYSYVNAVNDYKLGS